MNLSKKFEFARSGVNSAVIMYEQGDCSFNDPLALIGYREGDNTSLIAAPAIGDYIYTDPSLGTPLNGGNQYYRLGFGDPPEQLIYDNTYRIGTNGRITAITGCEGTGTTTLSISSVIPVSGEGTISISGGEPDEVINIQAILYDGAPDFDPEQVDTISLSGAGVVIGSLDPVHTIRNGTVTLSGTGSRTFSYIASPSNAESYMVVVQMTARSSGEPLPQSDSTSFAVA